MNSFDKIYQLLIFCSNNLLLAQLIEFFFRTASELIPSFVVPVTNCIVERSPDTSKPFSFQIINTEQNPLSVHTFHSSVDEDFRRWMRSLTSSSKRESESIWCGVFRFEFSCSAGQIMNQECSGFITISSSIGEQNYPQPSSNYHQNCPNNVSRKCYCTFKDAVLYCYESLDSPQSDGAMLLHGYTISNEADDLTALLIPIPEIAHPPLALHFSSPSEKHRWSFAIRNSLQLWINGLIR